MNKRLAVLAAILVIFLWPCTLLAFEIFEKFNTNPSGNWQTTLDTGSHSSFTWTTSGSEGFLRAHFVKEAVLGKYFRQLPSVVSINAANPSKKIYMEIDMQLKGGIYRSGDAFFGIGNSASNYKTNLAVGELLWQTGTAQFQIQCFGHDSQKKVLDVSGSKISPGDCIRLKYEIGFDQVSSALYAIGTGYNILENGTAGNLLYSAQLTQLSSDPNKVTSIIANIMGLFTPDIASGTDSYCDIDFDNFYISDTGFNSLPVVPTWRKYPAGLTVSEDFGTDPASRWTVSADTGSTAHYDWVTHGGNGYLDTTTRREGIRSSYTRSIGQTFTLDQSTIGSLGWYIQYDFCVPETQDMTMVWIGTGYSQAYPPTIWSDLDTAFSQIYGYNANTKGIKVSLNGYDGWGGTSAVWTGATSIIALNNTYRVKLAVGRNQQAVIVGRVFKINPDGSDGQLLAGDYSRPFGGTSAPLYADIFGLFSCLIAGSDGSYNGNSIRVHIDNFHFSDVGFPLSNQVPTWMAPPSCEEFPMIGDFGSSSGVGVRDCVIDFHDMAILAGHWLAQP